MLSRKQVAALMPSGYNPCGSLELQGQIGPNQLKGLVASVLLLALLVSSYWVSALLSSADPKVRIVVDDPSRIFKLVPINPFPHEQFKVSRPALTPPKAAIPIPVPQDEVADEAPPMPSQRELRDALIGEDPLTIGPGDSVVLRDVDGAETIPDRTIFVAFEVAPQPLPDFSPQPSYPEVAKISGVVGKVVVEVYVDKRGETREWRIASEKPADLGFGDEVLKVIPRWRFTPAIQQGNAIGVWISIPFNFKVKH